MRRQSSAAGHRVRALAHAAISTSSGAALPAPPGAYDAYLYRFYGFLSWLGVLLLAGLALWAAIQCALLSAWSAQAWNLQKVWLPGVAGGRGGVCVVGGGVGRGGGLQGRVLHCGGWPAGCRSARLPSRCPAS